MSQQLPVTLTVFLIISEALSGLEDAFASLQTGSKSMADQVRDTNVMRVLARDNSPIWIPGETDSRASFGQEILLLKSI